MRQHIPSFLAGLVLGAAIVVAFIAGRLTAPAPSQPTHASPAAPATTTAQLPDPRDAGPTTALAMSNHGSYVAAHGRTVFHLPACEWAEKIGFSNRATFATRDAALAAGYRPCRVCGP